MARQKIPGLSVAYATDLELRWSKGFGLADVDQAVPAKAQTVYRLASVSKPITAVAVMQLVEKGKIDLDRPVQTYVPTFPRKPWEITARHLLPHVSGIRHYKIGEQRSTKTYESLTEGLGIFKDDSLDGEPGTKFSYTSYGYNLLGCVVEGASGATFVDYLRENVFKPARMERAGADDVRAIIPDRARGYGKTKEGGLRNATLIDTSYKLPGGGLRCSAEDLAKFGCAFLRGELVGKETVERMITVQKTRDGEPVGEKDREGVFQGVGLGWFILTDSAGRRVIRHGGTQSVSGPINASSWRSYAISKGPTWTRSPGGSRTSRSAEFSRSDRRSHNSPDFRFSRPRRFFSRGSWVRSPPPSA